MATYTIDKFTYGGNTYVLQDSGALQLTGGNVTGPVNFGDSVTMDDLTTGQLIVTGNASFTNNINANTINGVAVGSNPKFTDTITTIASTSGSGNAVTAITASNGALTVTKGATFLTSHQDISGKANKATTLSGYGITDAYTKAQVDGLVASVFHYKGTKAAVADLPTSGNATGDVWHVTANGGEYAWDGSAWQELGSVIDLSNYKTKQTAVTDPTASSTTSTTFIDSISQDANGKISVTKKTLPTYNNYSHPTYTSATAAAIKVGRDSTGHVVLGNALTASDVGALPSNTTYVSTITTTAGAHTAITSKSGAVSFNVPTKTSHLTNDSGFLTSLPTHNHFQLVTEGDKRAVATTPNDYANTLVFRGLKTNSSFGNPSSDTYSYVIGLRGWSDSSGGYSHELAFNNTGIYWRKGATTAWGEWELLNRDLLKVSNIGNTDSYPLLFADWEALDEGDITEGRIANTVFFSADDRSLNGINAINADLDCGLILNYGAKFYASYALLPRADSYMKYINFYEQNSTLSSTVYLYIPDKSGTFALTSDIPTISASGTAPLTLSATTSGTSISITGSVRTATTSVSGVTTLTNSTSSTSTTTAATPSSVKTAYDLANTANTTANAAMPKAGGAFTGQVTAAASGTANPLTTANLKNIVLSTSAPSTTTGYSAGTIWIQYEA